MLPSISASEQQQPALQLPLSEASLRRVLSEKSLPRVLSEQSLPPMLSEKVSLMPTVVVFDGLGEETPREVSVNAIKSRFFVLGLQVGVAMQQFVLILVIVMASHDDTSVQELSGLYYPLFRGLFLLAYFGVMYGVLLFVWKRFGIDYTSIFHVPAGRHNYHVVIRSAFNLVTLNFACFVLFFLTLTMRLTPNKHLWPAAALAGTLALVAWPVDLLREWHDASQRAALGRTVLRVLSSPFSRATFAHTFVADILCSMPKCFNDILYTSCIYATGAWSKYGDWDADAGAFTGGEHPVCTQRRRSYRILSIALTVLPFWIRLMQCVRGYYDSRLRRHIANGLKYVCSISVIALSFMDRDGRSHAWLIMSCISTLYAAAWDVLVDWGLGPQAVRRWIHGDVGQEQQPLPPTHEADQMKRALSAPPTSSSSSRPSSWLLRPLSIFPEWVYYAAVTSNTVCRLGWALYISHADTVIAQHLILVLAAIELYRRAQWALLRVEWEQISQLWKSTEESFSNRQKRLSGAGLGTRDDDPLDTTSGAAGLSCALLPNDALAVLSREPSASHLSPRSPTVAERVERNRRRMQRASYESYADEDPYSCGQ